ncbi:MAG: hypothetical protein EOP92_31850 [Lysobacteraceae bacterium]|jgi:hypothetical protein|nr:MAG: hypothetical protein EOP92_31850 [Xanthomonadaceae bacterium]
MADECEWSGFVAQGHSGVREALFAAGVDCTAPAAGDCGAASGWEEPSDFSGHPQWRGHDGD